ncbi:MAG: hypothetical protein ISQ97_05690 [Flavobacteriales bacterium]|nr:hypothetical protein [Flavobacteriales bacterium]
MTSWMLMPQVSSQQLMHTLGNHKVELEGEKMRPGRAFKIANQECPLAGPHFAKARKMRIWNAVLLQVGIVEIVVGVLAIERDQLAFGIASAAAGGIVEGILSNRNERIQREVEEGARAFNQCHFMR